jgi:hypothetical protein
MSTRVKTTRSNRQSFYYIPGTIFDPPVWDQVVHNPEPYHKEWISETKVGKKVMKVQHKKFLSFRSGSIVPPYQNRYSVYQNHTGGNVEDVPIPALLLDNMTRNASELLTYAADTSGFELLTFMADIDDTLGMFTRKFLAETSYGSVTWGILPFLSDAKALVAALRNILTKKAPFCVSVNRVRPIQYLCDIRNTASVPFGDTPMVITAAQGVSRLHGTIVVTPPDTSAPDIVLKLLDELGVHPDLKTAWDIIPFSFVLDYFLPIGDILESLHPRGWGSTSAVFTGYLSHKFSANVNHSRVYSGLGQLAYDSPVVMTSYERTAIDGSFLPAPSAKVDFTAPSMKELFNTTYLTTKLSNAETLVRKSFFR